MWNFFLDKVLYYIVVISSTLFVVQGYFRYNILFFISKCIHYNISNHLYLMISIAIVISILRRNKYLPFLQNTVYPCTSLTIKTPEDASISRTLDKLHPNSNIIYWVSESVNDKNVSNPWDIYDRFSNSGVTISDENGYATVNVRPPKPFQTSTGFVLDNHIYYRECLGFGNLGQIKTIRL